MSSRYQVWVTAKILVVLVCSVSIAGQFTLVLLMLQRETRKLGESETLLLFVSRVNQEDEEVV